MTAVEPTLTLVNTDRSVEDLLVALNGSTYCGFDTESAGPLLRNRKWKGGKTFINVSASHMIGLSVGLPPACPPDSWLKKDGNLRKGKVLRPRGFYVPIRHNKKNVTFDALDAIIKAVSEVDLIWMHNAKHDTKTLLKEGYDVQHWDATILDSSIAAYLHRGTSVGNGLKALAEEYLLRKSPEFDIGFYNTTGAEALRYGAEDAVNTLELGELFFAKLTGSRDFFYNFDSEFAILLGEMEHHGLSIDSDRLRSISRACQERMAALDHKWRSLVKGVKIGSDHDLQKLFAAGVWPDHGEHTPAGAMKVNRESLEMLQHMQLSQRARKLVDLRLEYQTVSKIATTYTLGFIEEARQHPDGKLHPDYRQTGTLTGRLSSANPNGQNIPVRSALGKEVKGAIVPSPGYVFVALDYSQIELRVLAHFAGGKLAQAYINDEDVHQQTCDAIMKVTPCDRDKGKTVNFALQYGASEYRLAKILNVDRKTATRVREELLAEYPELDALKEALVRLADSRGPRPYVKTLAGRRAYVDDLLSGYNATRKAGERKAVNYTIQGSAFDIMKIAMVDTRAEFIADDNVVWNEDVRFVSNVHDEMTMEVRDSGELIDYVARNAQLVMEEAYELKVPLKAEPKVGRNWLETK